MVRRELDQPDRQCETRHEYDEARERRRAVVERRQQAPDAQRDRRGEERSERLEETRPRRALRHAAAEERDRGADECRDEELAGPAAEERRRGSARDAVREHRDGRRPARGRRVDRLEPRRGSVEVRALRLDLLEHLVELDELAEVRLAGLAAQEVHTLAVRSLERREDRRRCREERRAHAEALRHEAEHTLEAVRRRAVLVQEPGHPQEERVALHHPSRSGVRIRRTVRST